MYKFLLRPIFFLFDPEKIHHFTFKAIKILHKIPGNAWSWRLMFVKKHPALHRKVFGLDFENPVGLAAGFDKEAKLFNELPSFGFGFIEIGTLTPKGQVGNAKPRLFRIREDNGLINRMGFNNQGVDEAVENLKKRKTKVIIGGNIGKNTATDNNHAKEDYVYCFNALYDHVDYFVVNVSCPNIGNIAKLQDKDYLIDLMSTIQVLNKERKNKPVLLKIGPDLNNGQLDEIIEVIEKTGAAGVVASNTLVDRSKLKTSTADLEIIGNGGVSGKPVAEKSTHTISYLNKKSKGSFPIIGVGGIHSAEDAIEKLDAGASLVQIYTGFIYEGPSLIKKINKAIINRG
jgi:dihydroorotate dehydrogenase